MPDTTAHGFPYPLGSDRVMDGDNAIQALAEFTDALLAEIPRCKIEANGDQAIANASAVKINFTGGFVHYDNDNMADLANDRIVVRTAGLYRLGVRSSWYPDPDGFRGTILYRNTDATPISEFYVPAVPGQSTIVTWTTEPIAFGVGDVIYARVFHTAGSTRNLNEANGRFSHIAAEWVTW